MPLPCKDKLTDYTPQEVSQHFAEYGTAQVPNCEDTNRGSYLSILANGADKLPEQAFSKAISL